MLIILEGVDGAGKTTVAERLKERLAEEGPVHLLHRGPPSEHPLLEYEKPIDWYRPGCGEHIVCDRWHLGELIYGPLYRNESKLDKSTWAHVEMFLSGRGAVLVHMTQVLEVLQSRLMNRGETFLQEEHIERVRGLYDKFTDRSIVATVVQCVGGQPDDVDFILDAARESEAWAERLADFKTYVGHPRPVALLFGEQRGPNPGQSELSACFGPFPATSGHYLLGALHWDFLRDIGVANACEEDPRALWEALMCPLVVTLGVNAHKAVEQAGIPHGRVPHPQYIRRFHHKAAEEYGAVIWHAAQRRCDMSDWRPDA